LGFNEVDVGCTFGCLINGRELLVLKDITYSEYEKRNVPTVKELMEVEQSNADEGLYKISILMTMEASREYKSGISRRSRSDNDNYEEEISLKEMS